MECGWRNIPSFNKGGWSHPAGELAVILAPTPRSGPQASLPVPLSPFPLPLTWPVTHEAATSSPSRPRAGPSARPEWRELRFLFETDPPPHLRGARRPEARGQGQGSTRRLETGREVAPSGPGDGTAQEFRADTLHSIWVSKQSTTFSLVNLVKYYAPFEKRNPSQAHSAGHSHLCFLAFGKPLGQTRGRCRGPDSSRCRPARRSLRSCCPPRRLCLQMAPMTTPSFSSLTLEDNELFILM